MLYHFSLSAKVPVAETPVNQDKVKRLNKEQIEQRQHLSHGHCELNKRCSVGVERGRFIFVWSDHLLEPRACCKYSLGGQKQPILADIIRHLSTY